VIPVIKARFIARTFRFYFDFDKRNPSRSNRADDSGPRFLQFVARFD
jgi:hypothetical protein